MIVRVSGTWPTMTSGLAYADSAWRPLIKARAFIAGAWREVATFVPPLTLAASTSDAYGSRLGGGTVTTLPVSVTPTGGQAPYTYLWTRLSGFGSVTSPALPETTFSQSVGNGDEVSGVFRCTATDNLGATATADVTATFASFDMSGGA